VGKKSQNVHISIAKLMEYIRSLTEKDLCDFILNTKESLYICLPLLQPDVLDAIAEMDFYLNSNTPINIGIDFSPETFRQGYGEIKSYDDILMSGYNVLNMKDNRISFVISDNVGYYLFFESRYFIQCRTNRPDLYRKTKTALLPKL
jgi:hypothetical protein